MEHGCHCHRQLSPSRASDLDISKWGLGSRQVGFDVHAAQNGGFTSLFCIGKDHGLLALSSQTPPPFRSTKSPVNMAGQGRHALGFPFGHSRGAAARIEGLARSSLEATFSSLGCQTPASHRRRGRDVGWAIQGPFRLPESLIRISDPQRPFFMHLLARPPAEEGLATQTTHWSPP